MSATLYLIKDRSRFSADISNNDTSKFSFGINLSPDVIYKANAKNIALYDDLKELGTNFARYINIDQSADTASRSRQLNYAKNLQQASNNVAGNLLLRGQIPADRNYEPSKIADNNGNRYEDYPKVIEDIRLTAAECIKINGDNTKCDRLKSLIKYFYFQSSVIPRLQIYKDNIKYWQIWNEPDGIATLNRIQAEVLSLMTTGKVTLRDGREVAFGTDKAIVNGTEYSLEFGAGGIVADPNKKGIIKQICSDCTVVSAGFFQPREKKEDGSDYFSILRQNDYEESVEVNEFHLNLHPQQFMGYTRYYDQIASATGVMSIYDILCDGRDKCGKPFWSTEVGSPSDTKFHFTSSSKTETDADGNPVQIPNGFTMTFTREFQADDLIKRFVNFASFGLSTITWNGYLNNPDVPECKKMVLENGLYNFNSPDSLCHHQFKGLYYNDGDGYKRKPSYLSFKTATSKLGRAISVKLLSDIDKAHTKADQVFKYEITRQDSKKTYSAWCEPFWDDYDVKTTPKDWAYEQQNCTKTIDLSNEGITGIVTLTARDGSTSTALANNIPITKSPIFIEQLSEADAPEIESTNIADNQVISTNPFIITAKIKNPQKISKVDFYVDDNLISTSTLPDVSGNYEAVWDTSKYHSIIKIVAYTTTGGSSTITKNTTVKLSDGTAYENSPIVSVLPKTGEQNWFMTLLGKIRKVIGLEQ